MSGKEDAVASVPVEGTDSDVFTAEGLWDFPHLTLEADIGLGGGDTAHDLAFVIDDLRQIVLHGARAGAIAASRQVVLERLMRAFEIVQHDDRTPTGQRFASFCFRGIPGLVSSSTSMRR